MTTITAPRLTAAAHLDLHAALDSDSAHIYHSVREVGVPFEDPAVPADEDDRRLVVTVGYPEGTEDPGEADRFDALDAWAAANGWHFHDSEPAAPGFALIYCR